MIDDACIFSYDLWAEFETRKAAVEFLNKQYLLSSVRRAGIQTPDDIYPASNGAYGFTFKLADQHKNVHSVPDYVVERHIREFEPFHNI